MSDIVRGCLCPAIKSIFDHGLLRKSPLLSGPVHPWVFIEEAASKEVWVFILILNWITLLGPTFLFISLSIQINIIGRTRF